MLAQFKLLNQMLQQKSTFVEWYLKVRDQAGRCNWDYYDGDSATKDVRRTEGKAHCAGEGIQHGSKEHWCKTSSGSALGFSSRISVGHNRTVHSEPGQMGINLKLLRGN